LNLFSKDVEWFKQNFPMGYTEAIRDALRKHIRQTELMEDELRYGSSNFTFRGENE